MINAPLVLAEDQSNRRLTTVAGWAVHHLDPAPHLLSE